MSKNNPKTNSEQKSGSAMLFGRENYALMLLSIVFIVVGFTLMSGTEDINSTTKITVAPVVVLLGYIIGVFAIFFRKK